MEKFVDNDEKKPRIQSLGRADDILSEVMLRTGFTSLATLSDSLGLNKTTVFNLAESLVVLGYLERSRQSKGYRLGLRCLELGRRATAMMPILDISRASLREICHATRETVNLALPYLHEGIIVEALQSQQAVRATAYAGARTHYHSSACGKALLAHFPEEQRQWIYKNVGLPRLTEYTICDVDTLEADLARVRDAGYATDSQENELGAYCVAMPISGHGGDVVGAISVSGVIQRMTPELVKQTVTLLRQHTAKISDELNQKPA